MLARSTFLFLALAAPAAAADFTAEPAEVKVPAGTLKGTLVVPDGKGGWKVGLPALGRIKSRGWYDVGRFLGP